MIAEYDGALQLLPHAGTLDLYDAATWQRLHQHDAKADRGIFGSKPVDPSKSANVAWSVPTSARLARARASRDLVRTSPLDPNRMIYVAGVADQTPTDIVIDEKAVEGRRVTVMATSRGDGRVPWATGIPSELANQTYYMNAVHGDLANTEESFPAIVDLLSNGTTSKLSQTPPAVRGDAKDTFPLREAVVDAFPDDASLVAAAVGGRRGRKPRRTQESVRVSVVHDNLIWARWPVVVGHYRDDVFVGAEDSLDWQLNGRLRELQQLDLYPGVLQHRRRSCSTSRRHDNGAAPGGNRGRPGHRRGTDARRAHVDADSQPHCVRSSGRRHRTPATRGRYLAERRARARPRDHGAAGRRRRGRRDAGGFHPGDSSGCAGGQRAVPGDGRRRPGPGRRERKTTRPTSPLVSCR